MKQKRQQALVVSTATIAAVTEGENIYRHKNKRSRTTKTLKNKIDEDMKQMHNLAKLQNQINSTCIQKIGLK